MITSDEDPGPDFYPNPNDPDDDRVDRGPYEDAANYVENIEEQVANLRDALQKIAYGLNEHDRERRLDELKIIAVRALLALDAAEKGK